MSEQKERWWRRLLGRGASAGGRRDEVSAGAGSLRIRAAGGTDVGQVREQNEDQFACLDDRGVFIIADGMGGEAAGEEASRLAVEALKRRLTSEAITETLSAGPGLEPLFRQAVEEASEAILQTARSHPGWERMGTTVVIGVVRAGVIYLCNVGDSRAYLIRGGESLLPHPRPHHRRGAGGGGLSPPRRGAHPSPPQ